MLTSILSDRAVLYGVVTKAVQGVASFVSALFIIWYFTPAVQGYYYTFANILALQILLELGLSGVITTFAAHEWARLSMERNGTPQGDPQALSRLRSLTRKVATWYLLGAIALLVLLTPLGIWFLSTQAAGDEPTWLYPWLAMCLLAAVNFVATPAWALLAGCGQLPTLNAFRLAETFIRYAVLWTGMAVGASLWAVVGAITISTAVGCAFLAIRYRAYFAALLARHTGDDLNWSKELAPLQARIGISWICGYLAFSAFTPIVFHYQGAVEAGRMGMTWAFIAGLSGIAGTWLQVQSPRFAMAVARRDFGKLDADARLAAIISLSVFSFGSLIGLGALLALDAYRPDMAGRLLPVGPVAVFLLAELLHQASMVQSTYLRAFKQEPFLGVSILTGTVIAGGTWALTPSMGSYGPAVSYLAGVLGALAWGTVIFVARRNAWTERESRP